MWTKPITVAEMNKLLRPGRDPHLARYTQLLTQLGVYGLVAGSPKSPTPEELKAMATTDMAARHRVLYVEVAPSGAPMTPEGVSEDEARMWLEGMVGLFLTFGLPWRRSLDDGLAVADQLRKQLSPEVSPGEPA